MDRGLRQGLALPIHPGHTELSRGGSSKSGGAQSWCDSAATAPSWERETVPHSISAPADADHGEAGGAPPLAGWAVTAGLF